MSSVYVWTHIFTERNKEVIICSVDFDNLPVDGKVLSYDTGVVYCCKNWSKLVSNDVYVDLCDITAWGHSAVLYLDV